MICSLGLLAVGLVLVATGQPALALDPAWARVPPGAGVVPGGSGSNIPGTSLTPAGSNVDREIPPNYR